MDGLEVVCELRNVAVVSVSKVLETSVLNQRSSMPTKTLERETRKKMRGALQNMSRRNFCGGRRSLFWYHLRTPRSSSFQRASGRLPQAK